MTCQTKFTEPREVEVWKHSIFNSNISLILHAKAQAATQVIKEVFRTLCLIHQFQHRIIDPITVFSHIANLKDSGSFSICFPKLIAKLGTKSSPHSSSLLQNLPKAEFSKVVQYSLRGNDQAQVENYLPCRHFYILQICCIIVEE